MITLSLLCRTREKEGTSCQQGDPGGGRCGTTPYGGVSDSHAYVFVSIKQGGVPAEFFIVPSKVVAKKAYAERIGKDIWYSFTVNHAKPYQDRWELLK